MIALFEMERWQVVEASQPPCVASICHIICVVGMLPSVV